MTSPAMPSMRQVKRVSAVLIWVDNSKERAERYRGAEGSGGGLSGADRQVLKTALGAGRPLTHVGEPAFHAGEPAFHAGEPVFQAIDAGREACFDRGDLPPESGVDGVDALREPSFNRPEVALQPREEGDQQSRGEPRNEGGGVGHMARLPGCGGTTTRRGPLARRGEIDDRQVDAPSGGG